MDLTVEQLQTTGIGSVFWKKQMFGRNIGADAVIDVMERDELSTRWLSETLSP